MWPFKSKTPKYCLFCGLELVETVETGVFDSDKDYLLRSCPAYKEPGVNFFYHYHKYIKEWRRHGKFDAYTGAVVDGSKNRIRR